jgi:hypothetical protein
MISYTDDLLNNPNHIRYFKKENYIQYHDIIYRVYYIFAAIIFKSTTVWSSSVAHAKSESRAMREVEMYKCLMSKYMF